MEYQSCAYAVHTPIQGFDNILRRVAGDISWLEILVTLLIPLSSKVWCNHVIAMPLGRLLFTSSRMEQRTPTTMPERPIVMPDSLKPVARAHPSSLCAIATFRTFACSMKASQRKMSWHPAQASKVGKSRRYRSLPDTPDVLRPNKKMTRTSAILTDQCIMLDNPTRAWLTMLRAFLKSCCSICMGQLLGLWAYS